MLIEEPELYLRPEAQRYLYRLLCRFATDGNQVLLAAPLPETAAALMRLTSVVVPIPIVRT